MIDTRRSYSALALLAAAAQLLCVFPFAVLTEGVGFEKYTLWHYFALFAVYAAFMLCGRLCGAWAQRGGFTAKQRAWAVFGSRMAVIVPSAVFIIVCACLELPTSLYFYAFPAAVLIYFGGRRSAGLQYSDIMTRGWFAVYFTAAVITSFMLWLTKNEELRSAGMTQLCVMFGVLIVISAVLANQTNIDTRAQQRASGRNVIPKGLRGYNAVLIAAVCAAAVGLFLFAKPLARLAMDGVYAIVRGIVALLQKDQAGREEFRPDETLPEGGRLAIEYGSNSFMSGLSFLLFVGAAAVIIHFRKQITDLLKGLIAPLFRENDKPEPLPFADEFSDSVSVRRTKRDIRRTEQSLLKAYRKEQDPTEKYRKGYLLFLMRLDRTAFAHLPSDTTTVHGKKGTMAFRREDIDAMVEEYNNVRYGGKIPDEKQITEQEMLLNELY